MAHIEDALEELDDGKLYLQVTPGRAQALVEALDLALSAGKLDKRRKGVITAVRELLSRKANGQALGSNPSCWVYVVPDPDRTHVTKIGHALDPDRRFARCTLSTASRSRFIFPPIIQLVPSSLMADCLTLASRSPKLGTSIGSSGLARISEAVLKRSTRGSGLSPKPIKREAPAIELDTRLCGHHDHRR